MHLTQRLIGRKLRVTYLRGVVAFITSCEYSDLFQDFVIHPSKLQSGKKYRRHGLFSPWSSSSSCIWLDSSTWLSEAWREKSDSKASASTSSDPSFILTTISKLPVVAENWLLQLKSFFWILILSWMGSWLDSFLPSIQASKLASKAS